MWIDELKVGDLVFVYGYCDKTLVKVERLTKTLVIVNNIRFRKLDGRERGSDGFYHCRRIEEATPESISKYKKSIKRAACINKIKRFNLEEASDACIAQILSIIDQQQKGN